MREPESRSEHILSLARELLDDLELSRLATEPLLMKATRLARLAGSDEVRRWLQFELKGYAGVDQVGQKYIGLTGRWEDEEAGTAYWHSLAGINSLVATKEVELAALRIPDVSSNVTSANPYQRIYPPRPAEAINPILLAMSNAGKAITRFKTIRGKVLGLLHGFVAAVYYERLFSGVAESVFGRHKAAVDARLAGRCGDVLENLPSVYDRLAEGDPEAVSQALTTCRRIIDSFADSVFPATDTPIEFNGKEVKLGHDKVLNRIVTYAFERTGSDSRRKRLRQTLDNLYSRVSAGVHSEVPLDEARSLLLETYLVLGEIILIPDPPPEPALPG